MTDGGVKRPRTARGVFGFRSSNKDATADADAQSALMDSCTSRSDSLRTETTSKEGGRGIFRKSGSKLLSILKLRSSRGKTAASVSCCQALTDLQLRKPRFAVHCAGQFRN